jgi:pyruvate dehydrogenase E2 component (dihydrolipoamide acetyltransferase)
MGAELTMPKLSDSMADAVILKWLKSPGEAFVRGEALLEVETDKATVVYEAEADGTLEAILVLEGASASVGQPIATLAGGDRAASRPDPAPATAEALAPAEVSPTARAAVSVGAPVTNGGTAEARANATPVARRTALELGLSLHGLDGTGPGGRITADDVKRAAGSAAATAATAAPAATSGRGEVTVVEPTPTQATIARRMAHSAATVPVFTVSADADVSQIVAQRKTARQEGEARTPSLNDFVVKAAALALRDFPRFNASWVDEHVELYSRVNVGIAVATDDALVVPVVAEADRLTLSEIAAETSRLADAARTRRLRPEELHNATFTVSNLGMFGVRAFTAIVDAPQAAILAVGGVRRDPAEGGRGVVFRDVMTLTLSCDHRVVYGADGGRFLARLRELLEQPLALAL